MSMTIPLKALDYVSSHWHDFALCSREFLGLASFFWGFGLRSIVTEYIVFE